MDFLLYIMRASLSVQDGGADNARQVQVSFGPNFTHITCVASAKQAILAIEESISSHKT